MLRSFLLLIAAVAVGCGAPAGDTTPPPAEEAPAAPATPADDEGADDEDAEAEAEDAAMGSALDTTPVAFNPAGAPVVELSAPGMHCEMCAATIVSKLKEAPGVVDVTADAETKFVSVAVDADEFDADAAMETINEAGFGDAELVEDAG